MVSERFRRQIDRPLVEIDEAEDGQRWPRVQNPCNELLGNAPRFPQRQRKDLGVLGPQVRPEYLTLMER